MAPKKRQKQLQLGFKHVRGGNETSGTSIVAADFIASQVAKTLSQRSNVQIGPVRVLDVAVNGASIFVVDDAFNAEEVEALVAAMKQIRLERVHHRATREMAHRSVKRKSIKSQALASALWERVRSVIPAEWRGMKVAGLNSDVRFYKYDEGDRFGPHIDESVEDELQNRSVYTMIVYLNGTESGLKGGRTIFYDSTSAKTIAAAYTPVRGSVLFHGHGDECLLHEGEAVLSGSKLVVRTDVMYSSRR